MILVDGSHGEGGGQLLRTAVAIAALRGVAVRLINVRARRSKPGLAPQHVAAVRAVASLCGARCEGVELRSTAVVFEPGQLRGGDFFVDVGTAGSATLILQAMLPVLVASSHRTRVTIRGGTDVRAAPPADYLRLVLLPLLAKMGARIELSLMRRGYYPKGGGELRVEVEPVPALVPFVVEEPGPVERIEIHTHVSQLAFEIAQRMSEAARRHLPRELPLEQVTGAGAPSPSLGPGGAVLVRALTARTVLGAALAAERGIRAEQLGHEVAQALMHELEARSTLDLHAADQMLTFLALARGGSAFHSSELTSHAATTMWLLEELGGARFCVERANQGVRVIVQPADGAGTRRS